MSQHARRSMQADREVEIAIDDFRLTGDLIWCPTAHDYELVDVYLHQNGKCLAVDDPTKLGALHDGEFKSFDHLLRFVAEAK